MKEFIIVFAIALGVTSLFNGWNPFASASDQKTTQQSSADDQSFTGAAAQAAQQAAPQSGTSTPSGSAL